jgi:hypothetical protein
MRSALGGNLLIGALLDRLGSAQAHALLARLSESLCQNERDSYPTTIRTIERRRERPGSHQLNESTTSQTSKEAQP